MDRQSQKCASGPTRLLRLRARRSEASRIARKSQGYIFSPGLRAMQEDRDHICGVGSFDSVDHKYGNVFLHAIYNGWAAITAPASVVRHMGRKASSRDLHRETRRQVRKLLIKEPALQLPDVCRALRVGRHAVEAAYREKRSTFRLERSKIRMLCAKRALATSRPLKAVAADLGFGSPRSFSRFVANKIGKRPSDVRKERKDG